MNAVVEPVGRWRRLPSVLLALARVDARRPTSWLVAAATLVVVGLAASPAAAAGAGALLAVAAIGALMRGTAAADLRGPRLAARLVWPLGAAACAAAVACLFLRADAGRRVVVALSLVAAAVVTAGVIAASRFAAAGRLFGEAGTHEGAPAGHPSPVGHSWVDAAAMSSMLVAMAVCFFLVPDWSGWYAVLATSWFTLLAVPTATIVGGDAAMRRQLATASPGRPRWAGAAWSDGPTLVAYAAVLGWPAAVAAVVAREWTWGWSTPLAALVALACMAAAAWALAWIAHAQRWSEDAALATLAAAHATAIAAISRAA